MPPPNRGPALPPTECRIAIISRSRSLAQAIERDVQRLRHRVRSQDHLPTAKELTGAGQVDILLLDAELIPTRINRLAKLLPEVEDLPAVLVIASAAQPGRAFEWLEHGAVDVLGRPPHPAELKLRIRQVIERLELGLHLATLEDEIYKRTRRAFNEHVLIAKSPAMKEVETKLNQVAQMRTTVLILGESGVGKELVARTVHFRSRRFEGPFIAINCAALPPHLIESELFGHEKGAFTGATSRRAGKFELANHGTLFLDEVGETDPATQAKLLRVLEEQEFMRVGGTRPVRVDVRVVAATNADLEQMVRDGRMREDLYYRLKVVTIMVPPLRERKEDIPDLAQQLLALICRDNNLPLRQISGPAAQLLAQHSWPGNVRELMNALEAVLVSTSAETIEPNHLPPVFQASPRAVRLSVAPGKTLSEIEAEAIRSTLAATAGSRTRTAEILGIGLRTLRRKIAELGLDDELPSQPGRPRLHPTDGQ